MMLGSGLMTIATMIVKHLLDTSARKQADKKLDTIAAVTQSVDKKSDTITELSNSMLTHTRDKKEEAEKKLEQVKANELTELKTKLAEAEKTIALLSKPGDTKEGH